MNTTAKGDIAEQAVALALLKAGKPVLRPVSNGLPYDIAVDNLDGTFTRVQCKTGTLKCDGGVVRFRPRSADARRPNGVPYHGQIDAFGVHCPQKQQVYFVSIVDLGTISSEVTLWLLAAKSGQEIGIRDASPHSLKPRAPEVPGECAARSGPRPGLGAIGHMQSLN